MGIAALFAVALSGLLVWALTRSDPAPAHATDRRPSSPLDEAERILSSRYARGSISAQEYERMLVILRR